MFSCTLGGGLEKLAKRHGKNYGDFERVFRQHDDQVCKGLITPQQLWEIYVRELDLEIDDLDFAAYWVEQFVVIQITFELVKDLAKINMPLGVLSNIYSGVFQLIEQRGLFPFQDWQSKVLSCEHGYAKPEPRIYQIAEQQAGVPNEQILFIDDKAEFLVPAAQRGWQTFQFNEKNPTESVQQLREILQVA